MPAGVTPPVKPRTESRAITAEVPLEAVTILLTPPVPQDIRLGTRPDTRPAPTEDSLLGLTKDTPPATGASLPAAFVEAPGETGSRIGAGEAGSIDEVTAQVTRIR